WWSACSGAATGVGNRLPGALPRPVQPGVRSEADSAAPFRRRQSISTVQHYLPFGNRRLAPGRRFGSLGALHLLLVVFLLLGTDRLARGLHLLRSLEAARKLLDLAALELPTQITFDTGHQTPLVGSYQGHRQPLCTGPAGPAHAVQIVITAARHVEVDHQVQFTDVQAAGGHVGRHQHALATLLESLDGQLALLLVLLPVQYIHPQALYCTQYAIEAICHDPGVGEHDGLALALVEQQPLGNFLPVGVVVHRDHLLTNRRGIGLHAVQLEPARLIQDLLDHAADALIAGGGGEQHGLTLLGAGAGDTQHIFAEAHVQHAVSFVDNQGLNFGQVQPAGFQLLQGTTRGGNDDIRVLAQLGGLYLEVFTTDNQLGLEEGETRQRLNVLEDLLCQLPGGRQHQRPRG